MPQQHPVPAKPVPAHPVPPAPSKKLPKRRKKASADELDRRMFRNTAGVQYVNVEALGSGGSASVFRVYREDDPTQKPMVLKVFRDSLGAEAARRIRDREFELAQLHRHPRSPQAFHTGELLWLKTPRPYLAMEWIPGQDLSSRLQQMAAICPVSLVTQLVDVLGSLHAAGIVHGDIKPENIRLTDSHEVKLMDYGSAVDIGETWINGVSVNFAPPEAVQKGHRQNLIPPPAVPPALDLTDHPIGPAADLFSVGRLLQHIAGKGVPLPMNLAALMYVLLEEDPSHRPQTASEVAHFLI